MAMGTGYDAQGNPIDDGQYDQFGAQGLGQSPVPPPVFAPVNNGNQTFDQQSQQNADNAAAQGINVPLPVYNPGGGPAPAGSSGTTPQETAPAPAPATSQPQAAEQPPLPQFGMGNLNIPPPPTFDQPSDQELTTPKSGGNGLSEEDQSVRDAASSIFGVDPGAPGGQYSGGYGRRANPLRESDIGKRFAGASKAGTAYGNSFDKEGLMGGGRNASIAGGENADLGTGENSDLLLSLLQLLGG